MKQGELNTMQAIQHGMREMPELLERIAIALEKQNELLAKIEKGGEDDISRKSRLIFFDILYIR